MEAWLGVTSRSVSDSAAAGSAATSPSVAWVMPIKTASLELPVLLRGSSLGTDPLPSHGLHFYNVGEKPSKSCNLASPVSFLPPGGRDSTWRKQLFDSGFLGISVSPADGRLSV